MLRDEAIEALLGRLEGDPSATLRIHVDHGLFHASYATTVTPCEGESRPVLSDALVSLVEALEA